MPSTIYDIQLRYRMDDQASKGLDGLASKASTANNSAGALSGTLMRLAALAAAGLGMHSAGKALIGFNAEVQDVKLQIAGMLSLTRQTDLADEIGKADQLFANLQKRANTLPGTTAEYAHFAGMVTRGISEAGLSMKDLENLTVNAVVAAKSLGESADVAARDIDQALRGMYRSVDPFSGKVLGAIGYSGEEGRKKFNELSADQRASELKRGLMLKQWDQLAAAKGKTFSGILSTLQDTLEQTLGKVGLPLFERLSQEILNWNKWLSESGQDVTAWAKEMGGYLVDGFTFVKDAVAFMIENKDLLIDIGKIWLAVKAGGAIGGLLNGAGGLIGMLGSSVGFKGAGKFGNLAGGLGLVGAAGMAGWEIGRSIDEATGIGKIVMEPVARMVGVWDDAAAKHQAEMDKLSGSIERMDKAIADAADRAAGKGGAQGTQAAANLRGMADIAAQDASGGLALAKMKELNRLDEEMLGSSPSQSQLEALARRKADREERFRRSPEGIAAAAATPSNVFDLQNKYASAVGGTDNLLAQAMASLTEEQRKNVNVAQTTQAVMERMTQALSGLIPDPRFSGALGMGGMFHPGSIFNDGDVRNRKRTLSVAEVAQIINEVNGLDPLTNKAKGKKAAKVNVTIQRIEVKSDDPDRFAFGMVDALRSVAKNPTGAAAAIREG